MTFISAYLRCKVINNIPPNSNIVDDIIAIQFESLSSILGTTLNFRKGVVSKLYITFSRIELKSVMGVEEPNEEGGCRATKDLDAR